MKRLLFEIIGALLLVCISIFIITTYATSTYNNGYSIGHRIGYQSGYTNGKQYGYNQGYEDGHSQGQNIGYSDGVSQGNEQALQQLFDWITGSACEQSYYPGYIYFDLWKDSSGQIHYTCLV